MTILKRLFIFSTFFVLASTGIAQFDLGESAGYGNAGTTLANLWAIQYNQAGLAEVESIQAGIAYRMPFLVNETATQTFAVAIPVNKGSFGLSLNSFGYSLFREGKYGLAYGRKLGEDFNAGLQFNYESINIGENYGSAATLTIEGGIQYHLKENIILAAHIFNPNRSTTAEIEKSEVASVIKGGFRYVFSEKVFLTAETWKDSFNDPQVIVGMEFCPVETLKIRAGVSTQPTQASLGIGLVLQNFYIDLASDYHQELGITPNISLRYAR